MKNTPPRDKNILDYSLENNKNHVYQKEFPSSAVLNAC